jgi:uncharacterized protein YbaP (TraB family)
MKLLIQSILILFSTSVFAQEIKSEIPSVWAWEIKTSARTVYILGELHDFYLPEKSIDTISHKLGKEIYEISDIVWVEQQQKLSKQIEDKFKLSNQVEASTWENIKKGFKNATDSMKQLEEKQRNDLLNFYVENIDIQDPINASSNLVRFANAKITPNKPILRFFSGFGNTIKQEEQATSKRKLSPIENDQALATAWWNTCNDKAKAEILIQDALKAQLKNYNFINNSSVALQANFIKNENDVDSFASERMNDTDVTKIIMECVSIPRTKNWMPKIIEALSTKGPAITFLVGIGHVGGEQGILALLKKNGHTTIKRIYSLH